MRALNKNAWPYTLIVSDQDGKEVFDTLEKMGKKYQDWYAFSIYDNQSCIAVKNAQDYAYLKLRFKS